MENSFDQVRMVKNKGVYSQGLVFGAEEQKWGELRRQLHTILFLKGSFSLYRRITLGSYDKIIMIKLLY